MELHEELNELADRAKQTINHLQTEEATKNALIMPFIRALGYDVFNPTEVTPEFIADVGTKKGEKVDYAIFHENKISMLFECKAVGGTLSINHASQLYRYFGVTDARVGILTDGIIYKFFSDLERPNRMDERPFFEFNLFEFGEAQIAELENFGKDNFNVENILAAASELKYLRGIKRVIAEEWLNPSDDFVRLMASRVYSGRMTQAVKEQFTTITKSAFHRFVNERINERLKSAMAGDAISHPPENTVAKPEDTMDENFVDDAGTDIVTSDEEIEGYYIVKAIVSELVEPRRVYMRDTQSYCGVLLDDNNRKPICRLRFNAETKKYLGIFDEAKQEEKHLIREINDIFNFADQLRATVKNYDSSGDA